MRAPRPLVRGLAVARSLGVAGGLLLAAGFPVAAAAGPLPAVAVPAERSLAIWVGPYGVAFSPTQADDDDDTIRYVIRSHDGAQDARLSEAIPRGAGWVGFSDGYDALPGGYCVVSVTVPGIGTWHADDDTDVCTPEQPSSGATPTPSDDDADTATSSPAVTATPEPSTPSAPSRGTAPEPAASAAASAALPTAPSSSAPSATATPAPSDTPSDTPSDAAGTTPSPSASPSAGAAPGGEASPEPRPQSSGAAAIGRALHDSFTPDDDRAAGDDEAASAAGDARWSAAGMLVAVGAITAGAVALWRSQRRGGTAP